MVTDCRKNEAPVYGCGHRFLVPRDGKTEAGYAYEGDDPDLSSSMIFR
jgi:hypothetical protein